MEKLIFGVGLFVCLMVVYLFVSEGGLELSRYSVGKMQTSTNLILII